MGPYETMCNTLRSRVSTSVVSPLNLSLAWPNTLHTPPDPDPASDAVIWAGLTIEHDDTEIICIGTAPIYRKRGSLVLRVRASFGRLEGSVMEVGDDIARRLQSTEVGGITYEEPQISPAGRDGPWWLVDVTVPFFSDDVRTRQAEIAAPEAVTPKLAIEIVNARFCAAVAAVGQFPIIFGNEPDETQVPDWGRLSVVFGVPDLLEQRSTGSAYSSIGVATLQIYSRLHEGDQRGLEVADLVALACSNIVDRGVRFGAPSLRHIGRDGPGWRLDVRAPFQLMEAA